MKYWGVTLFMLIACVAAWGQQGGNRFTFISALHAPKASFDIIETRDAGNTVFGSGTVINVGSSASSSGTINVNGYPIDINTLNMEDGTQLTGGAGNRWLVDTLNIRPNGEVTVGALIAEKVDLNNHGDKDTAMGVTTGLYINGNAWTVTGSATSTLNAQGKEGNAVQFSTNGELEASATWKKLTPKPNSTDATEAAKPDNNSDKYYPVTTL